MYKKKINVVTDQTQSSPLAVWEAGVCCIVVDPSKESPPQTGKMGSRLLLPVDTAVEVREHILQLALQTNQNHPLISFSHKLLSTLIYLFACIWERERETWEHCSKGRNNCRRNFNKVEQWYVESYIRHHVK